jgi:wyosine [tRNA(Phe)-imidazoG37] synthetase (radical SAM superfamily)
MTRFLFGPVNSRRFGRSLGIDLLPAKVCCFDCLYCECGWTVKKTLERSELVPTADVLAEIDAFLADGPDIDVVTFAGAGEPTLHSEIGRIVAHIKDTYPRYDVCVLTSGGLLGDKTVRQELARADIVVPSLDGATPRSFRKICRPVHGLEVEAVIDGIVEFRRGFAGRVLLEIFVAPGMNDSDIELAALKAAAERIAPEAIQLNSLDRPAAFSQIRVATPEELMRIRDFLAPLPVQVVNGRTPPDAQAENDQAHRHEFLKYLESGPTTLNRLSLETRLREEDIAAIIDRVDGIERDGNEVRAVPPQAKAD